MKHSFLMRGRMNPLTQEERKSISADDFYLVFMVVYDEYQVEETFPGVDWLLRHNAYVECLDLFELQYENDPEGEYFFYSDDMVRKGFMEELEFLKTIKEREDYIYQPDFATYKARVISRCETLIKVMNFKPYSDCPDKKIVARVDQLFSRSNNGIMHYEEKPKLFKGTRRLYEDTFLSFIL